ncbi:hypothetical protein J6590_024893 [Homalodisca vitripennis]|nr:hypothetical protein J6590_024893 [Homalodisca vitripennis]
MPLSALLCARAITLIEHGLTVREVVNVSRSIINRAVIRFRLIGSYERRLGSGRNTATTARDNRYVVSLSPRNRFGTSVEVCNEPRRVRGVDVKYQNS